MQAQLRRGRHKRLVFGIGVVGLAGALTAAAWLGPDRAAAVTPPSVPRDAEQVVARVPVRDAVEVEQRRALALAPRQVDVAVALARADIERSRASADPRFLGHAEATLRPWWNDPDAPSAVVLLRATILQALHDFPAARLDLDRLIARDPDDAQAHLTRAVVATVTGDYAAARVSCEALGRLMPALVAAACVAPIDAVTGQLARAHATLQAALRDAPSAELSLRTWALTGLAELEVQRGDAAAAQVALAHVLALDAGDVYARGALADVLLDQGDPAAAAALLAAEDERDPLLLRRAIAEQQAGLPSAAATIARVRDRLDAAAARGDRVHLREEARFRLTIDGDVARALPLALANWAVQRELADARLVLAAALAARNPADAAPVLTWATTHGVEDVTLVRLRDQLAEAASR